MVKRLGNITGLLKFHNNNYNIKASPSLTKIHKALIKETEKLTANIKENNLRQEEIENQYQELMGEINQFNMSHAIQYHEILAPEERQRTLEGITKIADGLEMMRNSNSNNSKEKKVLEEARIKLSPEEFLKTAKKLKAEISKNTDAFGSVKQTYEIKELLSKITPQPQQGSFQSYVNKQQEEKNRCIVM